MVKSKAKWLKFKGGDRLGWQFQDRTGFMWLHGHEKEVEEEYAAKLLGKFPKNFAEVIEAPPAPRVEKTDSDKDDLRKEKTVPEYKTKPAISKKAKNK